MKQYDMRKTGVCTDEMLDYEKDSRFINYMKARLEQATRDREAGILIDSETVFAGIRDRYGW
jgi:hypothetical protein